jgi:hypothetical protein
MTFGWSSEEKPITSTAFAEGDVGGEHGDGGLRYAVGGALGDEWDDVY